MWLLKISGEDYAALSFEQEYLDENKMQEVVDACIECEHLSTSFEGDEFYFDAVLVQCSGLVLTPKFMDFLHYNIMDYDCMKHTNFYIVPDEMLGKLKIKTVLDK